MLPETVSRRQERLSFFISSRRRHTRCLSDWSSDVCSSDLLDFDVAVQRGMQTAGKAVTFTAVSLAVSTLGWAFSNIRFNSEMGLLLFLWMTISFASTMTLLPALMVIVRPKFMTQLVKPAEAGGAKAVATGTTR